MEEAYWKQFMTSGKIEDYLHFKGVSNIEGRIKQQEKNKSSEKTVPKSKWDKERESLR